MANRIMLNQTSYHGAGAIQEIVNEAKAHGFKKAEHSDLPPLLIFQFLPCGKSPLFRRQGKTLRNRS